MAAGDVTIIEDDFMGTQSALIGTVAGPAAYAAGGFALTTAKFGLATVNYAEFEIIKQDADEAFVGRYDRGTDKVQVYQCLTADALQEIGALDLSTFDIRFLAIGRK